jgi:hypothetical protein
MVETNLLAGRNKEGSSKSNSRDYMESALVYNSETLDIMVTSLSLLSLLS